MAHTDCSALKASCFLAAGVVVVLSRMLSMVKDFIPLLPDDADDGVMRTCFRSDRKAAGVCLRAPLDGGGVTLGVCSSVVVDVVVG